MISTSGPTLSLRANPEQTSPSAPTPDADHRAQAVQHYLHLTRKVLPEIARRPGTDWPVVNDHCFQRIVLDTISGGVWYDHIPRPAYKHLTSAKATEAVTLCKAILAGKADLHALNRQSLMWRGKLGQAGDPASARSEGA